MPIGGGHHAPFAPGRLLTGRQMRAGASIRSLYPITPYRVDDERLFALVEPVLSEGSRRVNDEPTEMAPVRCRISRQYTQIGDRRVRADVEVGNRLSPRAPVPAVSRER